MSENDAPQTHRLLSLLTAGVLILALAAVFLVGMRIQGDPDPATTGVVTTGQASVDAKPDQLKFTVAVRNKAATTAEAMKKTSAGIKAVTAALTKAGIAEKDIQTTSVSVEPTYRYTKGEETITGYESSSSLRVLVRKLASSGDVISAAATAAGNTATVRSVSMSISKKADLVAEARDKAVKNSKKAARALADAAGRSVDELVYVEEISTSGATPRNLDYAMDGVNMATAASIEIPISAGQQKVSVSVKVRWSLS